MMTGRAGVFAGGDMVPSERTVTVAVGHGKKAARYIDAWLRGAPYAPPAQACAGELRQAQRLVLRRRARRRCGRCSKPRAGVDTFEEVRRRARRDQRALRGAPLPVLRQLLRMRQLLRRLPGQRGHQARARQALQVQLRLLQGLRHLRRGMPLRRHRDGGRGDLRGPGAPAAPGSEIPWHSDPSPAADGSVSVPGGKVEMLLDPAKARLGLADQDCVTDNDRMVVDHRAPQAHDLVAELFAGCVDLGVYSQDIGSDVGPQRTHFGLKLGLGLRHIRANITKRPQDQIFGPPTHRLSSRRLFLSLLASRRDD